MKNLIFVDSGRKSNEPGLICVMLNKQDLSVEAGIWLHINCAKEDQGTSKPDQAVSTMHMYYQGLCQNLSMCENCAYMLHLDG